MACVPFQRTTPPVAETDELVTVNLDAFAHNGPDDGIQSRAVPTTGQHSDAHRRERTQDSVWTEPGSAPQPTRLDWQEGSLEQERQFQPDRCP